MKIQQLIFTALLLLFSSFAYADIGTPIHLQNNITLHTNPADNATTVATLAAGQEIIPIFMQNGWVKVANPNNGDVGWIKTTDLQQPTQIIPKSISSFQQINTTTTPSGTQSYVIIQQGNSAKKAYQIDAKGNLQALDDNQVNQVLNQMKAQQQQMQEQMYRMMSSTCQNFLETQALFTKLNQQIAAQMNKYDSPIVVIHNTNTPATTNIPSNKTVSN